MIAYEELCDALERFKRRQANQAELDQLNTAPAAAASAAKPSGDRREQTTDTFSLKPQPGEEGFAEQPEDTHEIDVDDVVVDS
jgi:hypothetical protein